MSTLGQSTELSILRFTRGHSTPMPRPATPSQSPRRSSLRIVFLVALTAVLYGQPKQPAITSPEVRPDRSVVFRLWAPSATDVQLSGDWMGPTPPQPLTKDENGVWTVTSGPFDPNIYTYGFLINGVRTSDPACRCTLAWAGRSASSKFVIPASPG